MRQFVFVVAMVAAAFLGGAAANGPGLRWVQARLLDYMGLKDGGEIASVNLPQPPLDPSDPRRPTPSASTVNGGTAPAVVSSINSSNPRQDQSTASTASPNRPAAPAHPTGKLPAEQTLPGRLDKSSARAAEDPASSQSSTEQSPPPLPVPKAIPEPAAPRLASSSGEPTATSNASNKGPNSSSQTPNAPAQAQGADPQSSQPAPLDASIGPALLASLSPSPSSQPGSARGTASDAIPLEVAPGGSSSTSLHAGPSSSAADPSTAATSAVSSDWGNLRRKMQGLGVTRYTIEGKPGGPVVFSCLIPLAGRQAVMQRFEAEGEDELHAAQVAIRRVALWRAAQSSATSSPTPAR